MVLVDVAGRDLRPWPAARRVRRVESVAEDTALFDIEPEECADLLSSAVVGRLGVMLDCHPEIFPVNHVYDAESGCVMFPSNPGTKLGAAVRSAHVAFEADGYSQDGSRGWSVLVIGRAEEIEDPTTIEGLLTGRERLWRAGASVRWLRIVPTSMTGRRICNADRAAVVPSDRDGTSASR